MTQSRLATTQGASVRPAKSALAPARQPVTRMHMRLGVTVVDGRLGVAHPTSPSMRAIRVDKE